MPKTYHKPETKIQRCDSFPKLTIALPAVLPLEEWRQSQRVKHGDTTARVPVESSAYRAGVAKALAVMAGEAEAGGGTVGPASPSTTPAMIRVRSDLATVRRWRPLRPRLTVFYPSAVSHPEKLLAAATRDGARRVLLVGPRHPIDTADFHAWAHAPVDGWTVENHYTERASTPVLRWRSDDGRRVVIERAASWFGETSASRAEIASAWELVGAELAREFRSAVLLDSPATTGRELLAREIPDGKRWPVLPDEIAHLVRSTSGQGRLEMVAGAAEIGQLIKMDGRFMYGALCHRVPAGGAERWQGEHPHGEYARCRLRASWTVPEGWAHVGILPMMGPHGTWVYPRRPGEHGTGWVDGAELHLARQNRWSVTVHESLVWPDDGDPLGLWADKLQRVRAAIHAHPDATAEVRDLGAAAVRKILIDAIGALVGRGHVVTRSVAAGEPVDLPVGAHAPRMEGGAFVWGESTGVAWPEMVHPEWSASIWAKCRVRLLDGPGVNGRTGALHVDPQHVVAFRTDALYLASEPAWRDDGRNGRLRCTWRHEGPLRRPTTAAELLAVSHA